MDRMLVSASWVNRPHPSALVRSRVNSGPINSGPLPLTPTPVALGFGKAVGRRPDQGLGWIRRGPGRLVGRLCPLSEANRSNFASDKQPSLM